MAEYSLYFGTHGAHKANAWISRVWLHFEITFLKQKDDFKTKSHMLRQ